MQFEKLILISCWQTLVIKINFNQIYPNLSEQINAKNSVDSSYFVKVTLYLQQEKNSQIWHLAERLNTGKSKLYINSLSET